jgi:hypothetical protein
MRLECSGGVRRQMGGSKRVQGMRPWRGDGGEVRKSRGLDSVNAVNSEEGMEGNLRQRCKQRGGSTDEGDENAIRTDKEVETPKGNYSGSESLQRVEASG